MTNVVNLHTHQQRKAVGDAHEERVRRELERRGWTVMPYGQGVWPEAIRDAIRGTESIMRWEPDIVCARGSCVRLIDCKASMRGEAAWRYNISRRAIEAHTLMAATRRLAVFYVFDNLGVMTPADLLTACRLDSASAAGAYLTIDAAWPQPFDNAFGMPLADQVERVVRELPAAA